MSEHRNFTIVAGSDGKRSFGGNAKMDQEGGQQHWSSRGRPRGRGGFRGRPFRGRGRGRGRGGGFQHDDRYEINPRSRIDSPEFDEDGDLQMADSTWTRRVNSRYNPYKVRGKRGGYTSPRGDFQQTSFEQDGSWFKISIPGGRHHDRAWLIRKLNSASNCSFQPVEPHHAGDTFLFFLEDADTAMALKRLSSKITCKDGSKILINVRPSPPPRRNRKDESIPEVSLDNQTEEVFMACLANRYDGATNLINLSNIMDDQVLKSHGVVETTQLSQLLGSLFHLVHLKCSQVRGLDLSNNNLQFLDPMKQLHVKTPELEILFLKNNKIRNVSELKKIEKLKSLTTLDLSGNGASSAYQKFDTYASEVRAFFPKLIMLDGRELPPPITFDLPKTTKLPASQPSFVPDPNAKAIITEFVKQYFKCYDSEDRQGLLEIYHDQATFSLAMNNMVSKNVPPKVRNALGNYVKFSRNLKRLADKDKRNMLIKSTRLATVGLINDLPRTKHYLETFSVDVTIANTAVLGFTIRGIFSDDELLADLAFSRTFLTVPSNSALQVKVINDQLHVRSMTPKQVQEIQKLKSNVSGQSLAEVLPAGASPSIPTHSFEDSLTPEKQEAVLKFSQQSKMSAKYSLDCLKQNDWNYDKAARVFTALQREGRIPPEAFVSQVS